MRGGRLSIIGWMAALSVVTCATTAAADGDAGKAIGKLGRGFVNIVTGWVEIPKRIQETGQTSGTAAALTWGLLRGLGHGFVRTAAGFYEFFTFPFPAPPDYAPVIQPEYVFLYEPSANSAQTAH